VTARTRNIRAFEHTLAALRTGGRLEAVDTALVAVGRTLAALMDDADEPVVSTAWAYLAVLKQLRGVSVDADDGLAELISGMRASMGDAPEP
jgi:hypothetical protein